MYSTIKKTMSVLIAVTFVTACSSTTTIQVTDPMAKIYVDGQMLGKGSVQYSDTKIIGSTTPVMLKKDGCDSQTHYISRDGGLHVGALIGGLFFLVPFLWVTKYRPGYTFDLDC